MAVDSRLCDGRCILCHVQFYAYLLIQLKLHNEEWISGLTLAERRVKTQDDEGVGIVVLW